METKTIRHNTVPYMDPELRRLQYDRNVMRNRKNKKPKPQNLNSIAYCEMNVLNWVCRRNTRGSNNQHFWPIIISFINNKYKSNKDSILWKNDSILIHPNEVANVLSEHITPISDGVRLDDPNLPGYENDDVPRTMIAKYDSHPCMITIKMPCPRKMSEYSLMPVWRRYIIY